MRDDGTSINNTTREKALEKYYTKDIHRIVMAHKRFARVVMPFMHSAVSQHISSGMYVDTTQPLFWGKKTGNDHAATIPQHTNGVSRRRLLVSNGSVNWKQELSDIPLTESMGAVQAYSSLVGGAGWINPDIIMAAEWLEGPFMWPPINRQMLGMCPSGEAIVRILDQAFTALGDRVMNPQPAPVFAHQRINATFPAFHRFNSTSATSGIPVPKPSSTDPFVEFFLGVVKSFITDIMRVNVDYIIGFAVGGTDEQDEGLTFAKVAKEYFTCDFENVLTCKKKTANVFVGGMAVIFILMGFYSALGSTAGIILGGISTPLMILWYVYGYSPACVPMVPECAVQDLIAVFRWLVPLQISWPVSLQKIPGCALNKYVPYEDCFISCSEPPFSYTSWEATVSWAACDWDPHWCHETVSEWAWDNNFFVLWTNLVTKFRVIEEVYTGISSDDLLQV